MTARALSIATLLMTAATMLSEPAVATDLNAMPYPSPAADVTVNGGAVYVRRPVAERPTLPMASGGQTGSAPDFEQLVNSYASVTHGSDGTTSVTPASADLRALLELEYEAEKI